MAAFERSAVAAADADTLARLTMQDALHSIQQCAGDLDARCPLWSAVRTTSRALLEVKGDIVLVCQGCRSLTCQLKPRLSSHDGSNVLYFLTVQVTRVAMAGQIRSQLRYSGALCNIRPASCRFVRGIVIPGRVVFT